MMIETTNTPPPDTRTDKRTRYPWHTINVGEGFIIPAGERLYNSIRVYACQLSKQGKKFITHLYEDGRIHVWRQS